MSLPLNEPNQPIRTDKAADAYNQKPAHYFANCRRSYVDALPQTTNAVLEIGCGSGSTGEVALKEGRCSFYAGVELVPSVAAEASTRLSKVVAGNIEHIDLPWHAETFDVLIMSEVLEHLAYPCAVLKKLRPFLRPGGLVMSSSPNVSHYSVILRQLRGEWPEQDRGVFDRTHLRWFTPRSYAAMFSSAGYSVLSVEPVVQGGWRRRCCDLLTLGKFRHLFWRQIDLRATRSE